MAEKVKGLGRRHLGAGVVASSAMLIVSMVFLGNQQDLAYISAPAAPPTSARFETKTNTADTISKPVLGAQDPAASKGLSAPPASTDSTPSTPSQAQGDEETSSSANGLGLASIVPPSASEGGSSRPDAIAGELNGDLWFKDLKLADVDTRYGLLRALAGQERVEKIACSPSLQKMGTAALERLDAVNCAGDDLRIAVGLVRGQMTSLSIEDSTGAELMAIHGPKGLNVRLAGLTTP